jgi:tripartite-type tricarboxylate transporter receptor subunit TctC
MRRLVGRVLLAVVLLLAGAARAENYPSRLIRAMIPYGAGSAADVVPRLVLDRLSAELGQAIVVENRPGAGAEVMADILGGRIDFYFCPVATALHLAIWNIGPREV